MRTLRIFLLALIIIGIGLILKRDMWVPKVVTYMLKGEDFAPIKPVVSTTTPTARPGKLDTGVEGIATTGPTCPVERIPPDPQCADKPYRTTLVITSVAAGRNEETLVQTDDNGYFSQELVPGIYAIQAQSSSVLPRLSPETFTVTAHHLTSLNLQFDSGIR